MRLRMVLADANTPAIGVSSRIFVTAATPVHRQPRTTVHCGHDDHFARGTRWVSEWTISGTTVEGERIDIHATVRQLERSPGLGAMPLIVITASILQDRWPKTVPLLEAPGAGPACLPAHGLSPRPAPRDRSSHPELDPPDRHHGHAGRRLRHGEQGRAPRLRADLCPIPAGQCLQRGQDRRSAGGGRGGCRPGSFAGVLRRTGVIWDAGRAGPGYCANGRLCEYRWLPSRLRVRWHGNSHGDLGGRVHRLRH